MAPRARLAVPTIGALPHTHRLPSNNPEVVRALSKLKRESLISLALSWMHKNHRAFCQPFLYDDYDPDDAENGNLEYDPPAQCLEELQEVYEGFKPRKGSRKEIAERILEGDWRHGISLYQLAMAEERHLLDNPNSLRWSAKRLVKVRSKSKELEADNPDEQLPRFHANTFLLNLAREVSPLMKAHYYLSRHKSMGLVLLRVYIHDSPYNTEQSLGDVQPVGSNAAKTVFVAFPDGSPFVYLSIATSMGQTVGTEGRSLRGLVLDSVPKALSKPFSRYEFQPTSLSTRSLSTLLTLRGSGRSNAAPGGWSIFVENSFNKNALDFSITPPSKDADDKTTPAKPGAVPNKADKENSGAPDAKRRRRTTGSTGSQTPDSPLSKRRKQVAEGRFGNSGLEDDGKAIERVEVRIDDPFPANVVPAAAPDAQNRKAGDSASKRRGRPSLLDRPEEEAANAPGVESEDWQPDVRLTFYGTHVFAGIRQLAEQGVVDGEKMPGWMTGEAGVSVGVVKDGKIRKRIDVV